MHDILKQNIKSSEDSENLIAMVSHDLKNPVNASILAIKMLENPEFSPLNAYQKEILDNIYISMEYMKMLLDNILDRYRFNNGTYRMNQSIVDFKDFVTQAIDDAKYLLTEKFQTVKLIVELKNSTISLDTLEIKRAINNLISNSARYSPERTEIIIRIFERENFIGFSIENKSNGVVDVKNVLKKFVSYSKSTKTIATGLGLYIVKEIINAHNGEVYVENEADNFTRVTFLLPRK